MCRAILRNSGNQKYIMVLTDEDIISLLTMVSDAQRDTKTSEFLQVKLDELISIG
jgi:hypothetical protein